MASKTFVTTTLAAFALAAAVTGCKGSEPAATTTDASGAPVKVSDTIEAREANFKAIAKANKAAKEALEDSAPDFAAVSASATSIQTDAGKIVGLFPKGSGKESGEKTQALPAIWDKPAEFTAAAEKLAAAAGKLKIAADAKDAAGAQVAMGEIGGACKGCHENFREKKQ
ncbi:c-type cytochrome [Novosphingobium sp. YAF33]|jgi:cytochrome c556|uniref:c-type cytochrome n=1 Tax=Novosphingobium sp. YAF33 TaxID=3233082 RepID=UPI003F99E424